MYPIGWRFCAVRGLFLRCLAAPPATQPIPTHHPHHQNAPETPKNASNWHWQNNPRSVKHAKQRKRGLINADYGVCFGCLGCLAPDDSKT